MPVFGIAQAKLRFSELVARAERGEEIVIARKGRPVVRLIAAGALVRRRQPAEEGAAAAKTETQDA